MLTFLGLSVLLILTPGPNQALLTSRVLSGGRPAGWAVVRGLTCGMALHVVAAIVGLSALLASSATVFGWVKLLGGIYLVYLGVTAFVRARTPVDGRGAAEAHRLAVPRRADEHGAEPEGGRVLRRGRAAVRLARAGRGGPGRAAAVPLRRAVRRLLVGLRAAAARRARARAAPRVQRVLERVTGTALVGLGVRLAAGR